MVGDGQSRIMDSGQEAGSKHLGQGKLIEQVFALYLSPLPPGAVDPAAGPDDMLYYASIGDGAIYKIEYVGGTNQLPVPVAQATPSAGRAPLNVFLDGLDSFDPDGGNLTYRWIFGDNTGAAELPTINHVYLNTNIYTATLEVSDGTDLVSQDITIVIGNDPPIVTVNSPIDGSTFNAGDTINFSAVANDPQEGMLGGSAFIWSILFHHNTHVHPTSAPSAGRHPVRLSRSPRAKPMLTSGMKSFSA